MEYLILYDKREHHWSMVFEDNGGGVDDHKSILHAKRWYVYLNKKEALIKWGYSVEVSGSDRKKVLCEVLDDYIL